MLVLSPSLSRAIPPQAEMLLPQNTLASPGGRQPFLYAQPRYLETPVMTLLLLLVRHAGYLAGGVGADGSILGGVHALSVAPLLILLCKWPQTAIVETSK